ncbi:six-hairpin glycosidase-like protein [Arenibacter aquaticus]|uniref:Six-hairpin glycosidase-like protein n=1 Tax=Arenibacter aquaticus TaxID=2489054 RepID=A0A3S0CLA8_9FLAO|nr:six-hairpin glycosidase-like protein [Arenibacter aquaticus]RTE53971.1 six-hairpin glycosidase-like protein [Arenibacter aquaticus]
MKKKIVLAATVLLFGLKAVGQVKKHWNIVHANEIAMDLSKEENIPYSDNIEMAGKRVAGIISYEINEDKELSISREIFFPQLRTYIKTNDAEWKHYRAYFKDIYSDAILPSIIQNNKIYAPGKVSKVHINGMLQFVHEPVGGVALTRTFFPSMSERLFVEQWTLTNTSEQEVNMLGRTNSREKRLQGVKGEYTASVKSNIKKEINIPPGGSYTFSIGISATLNKESEINIQGDEYYKERLEFLRKMKTSLTLETPNQSLNTLFEFSKIRASESIFESKLGLLHSPGGGRYYVGFWANDQAEYVNPFFPYLGYDLGNDAAMNMYDLYDKETNKEYSNIRYSFEIEGDAPINPLDRGDAAMIAYGAAQYALASGDRDTAEKLWPLISWCLEYNHRQLNEAGVVASESDEMEGRIETGNANLSTSSLYYGALNLARDLSRSLGKPRSLEAKYRQQAKQISKAIEVYFGATIEGLDTYKYYKEHQNLRHWICLPLVVQLFDRKDDTTKALFEKLWSENGVHVEKNDQNKKISEIFWDRGTLYALRGTFLAGATEESIQKLTQFTDQRLLGSRVPYVVEAYPEGNMAHLSAESGLYCRVFTEGMFGIVPTGLKSFECTPRLPKEWEHMSLKNIKAFGEDFNIEVKRSGKKLMVYFTDNRTNKVVKRRIAEGKKIAFEF